MNTGQKCNFQQPS